MKKTGLWILLCALTVTGLRAQEYAITFRTEGGTDSVLYIGEYYRDALQVRDSARRNSKGEYRFAGKGEWNHGIYALMRKDAKKSMVDFVIDGDQRFGISGDKDLTLPSLRVSGSRSNQQMVAYMARLQQAKARHDSLQRAGDTQGLERLNQEMTLYEKTMFALQNENLFFRLVQRCENPRVPDSVQDKALYYRMHYWDRLLDGKPLAWNEIHSPQLFEKMNYYFFGVLYRADSDTICASIDRLMQRIGHDTAMVRYVLQHIEPNYYRSSARIIGWDAVWCHLVERYYLPSHYPWQKESDRYVMTNNWKRIRQSIIGAHGQELWMLDTTQIDKPEHWISSHRFPNRYVILWFWDPDCHHCQQYSAELKVLYDSLQAAGDKRLEIYAIGYDSDVEKWKRYVREHDFRWPNVGGPQVNVDYQEAYNVHSAPTMIILDERRDIIMNKVVTADQLLRFLDEHEKRQAVKPEQQTVNSKR